MFRPFPLEVQHLALDHLSIRPQAARPQPFGGDVLQKLRTQHRPLLVSVT